LLGHAESGRLLAPPHIRVVERILRRLGFAPRSGKGDHVVWSKPNAGTIVTDPAMSPGVFRNVLKQLDMSRDQFMALA